MKFEDWGLIDYGLALAKQRELLEKVRQGDSDETVVFCTHPAVVTVGRKKTAGDIFGWTGPVIEVSRGGRATYHGPHQVIIYPILDLRRERPQLPPRDIHQYLRVLERVVISCLQKLGISGQSGESFPKQKELSFTGVWVREKKLASIGVGIKNWISYHGIAINVDEDPQAFTGINPCGFQAGVMTSIASITGHPTDRGHLQILLKSAICEALDPFLARR